MIVRVIASLLLAGSLLHGGDFWNDRLWKASVISLGIGTALDVHSSWGGIEANPLIPTTDGRFGWKGALLKAGVVGVTVTLQSKVKRQRKLMTLINFMSSAALVFVAVHNYRE